MLGQVLFFKAEESEVRQVAEHRLEPTVLRQNLAHWRIVKLHDVKREHGDVLRSPGRGDRIEDRLGKVFAEKNAALFKFEDFGDLIAQGQSLETFDLFLGQSSLRKPVGECRFKTRFP